MSKLKLIMERAIINDNQNGYCYVAYKSEMENSWIEIHGNMDEKRASEDYPLCLESDEEIDDFAAHLKTILKQLS